MHVLVDAAESVLRDGICFLVLVLVCGLHSGTIVASCTVLLQFVGCFAAAGQGFGAGGVLSCMHTDAFTLCICKPLELVGSRCGHSVCASQSLQAAMCRTLCYDVCYSLQSC